MLYSITKLHSENISIEPMSILDYKQTIRPWMVKEGWQPGKFDEQIYFSGEPDQRNFFVLKKNNTIIAALMVYTYKPKSYEDNSFSFFGAYITHQDFRHQGYGIKLWNFVMARIHLGTIGAYAVPKQFETYRKSGFNGGFFDTRRLHGISYNSTNANSAISKASIESLDKINAYDKQIFPADRKSFLEILLKLPSSTFIFTQGLSNNITGFAAIREIEGGYRIGPIEADNLKIAIDLVLELINSIPPGQNVFLDCDPRNRYLNQLQEYFQFDDDPNAKCITIYKGQPFNEENIDKKYALLSIELS